MSHSGGHRPEPRSAPLATLTCEAGAAKAAEAPTWVLQAVPGVSCVAGARATLIDISLTAQASVSWGAGAAEAAHQVHTGAVVQAPGPWVLGWAWATVVLINLTENPWGKEDWGSSQGRAETQPPSLSPALALAYRASPEDRSRDIGPQGRCRSPHAGRAPRHTHPRQPHSCHQHSQLDTVVRARQGPTQPRGTPTLPVKTETPSTKRHTQSPKTQTCPGCRKHTPRHRGPNADGRTPTDTQQKHPDTQTDPRHTGRNTHSDTCTETCLGTNQRKTHTQTETPPEIPRVTPTKAYLVTKVKARP